MAGLVALREDYSELYDASVRLADARLGSVIAALKERGEWDNTLFVLLADHGEELGEHGGWSHDQSVYEELLHVPLVVRFPGGRYGGQRVSEVVSLVDVMPTVLAALERPALAVGTRGRDLMPVVRGEAWASGEFFVPAVRWNLMSTYARWQRERGDMNVVVRSGAWKGIWNADLDTFELYDLDTDPGELVNVAERQPERVAAMREHVTARYADCGAAADEQAGSAGKLGEEALRNLRALGYVE